MARTKKSESFFLFYYEEPAARAMRRRGFNKPKEKHGPFVSHEAAVRAREHDRTKYGSPFIPKSHYRIVSAPKSFGSSRDPRPRFGPRGGQYVTPRQRAFISKKVPVLIEEGHPRPVAVAIAYRMAGVHRPRGMRTKHLTPGERRQELRARARSRRR